MARIDLTGIYGKRYRFGDADIVSVDAETGKPNRDNSIDYIVRVRSNLHPENYYLSISEDGHQFKD